MKACIRVTSQVEILEAAKCYKKNKIYLILDTIKQSINQFVHGYNGFINYFFINNFIIRVSKTNFKTIRLLNPGT